MRSTSQAAVTSAAMATTSLPRVESSAAVFVERLLAAGNDGDASASLDERGGQRAA